MFRSFGGPATRGAVSAALFIALIGVPLPAAAQTITGDITGTVKDQSGGAIPGATVVVRNVGTNAALEVTTDRTGVYVAPLLPIGDYEVTVELEGFKKFVRSGLRLSVNDRLRIDVTLEPGAIQETITVVAESPVVKTETSEISTLINQTQMAAMPLNGRSVIQLVSMQPGVASNMGSTVFPGLQGGTVAVFVNGSRASQNAWMIDGADNTDVGSNLGLINFVNVDAVEEVKILRSNYTAEFGRSGGGQVNVVTKSGTNAFRGSGFWFVRNDQWDASPFFGTYDPDKNGKKNASPLDYDNYGYTIGGPIVKNRLFFFWGNEYRNIRQVRGGGVQNTRTPTDRQRNGDFSEFSVIIRDPLTGLPFPGNVIPSGRIDPLARAMLDRFPAPNADPAVLGGNRNFSDVTQTILDFREELLRIDYRFSDRHSVYGRFIHDTLPADQPYGEVFGSNQAAFPGIASLDSNQPGRGFVGAWNWIVAANKLNEFSYQYSRGAILSELNGDYQRDVAVPKIYTGNPGDDILPGISFGSGGYGGWNFFGPYDNTYGSHRFKDTFTWNAAEHALKFGMLLSWEFKNENAASGTNGAFTFPGTSSAAFTSTGDAFADFLLGRASAYSEGNIDMASRLRFQMYEAFVQDDWKVKPNLTINAGLRWSYIGQPYDTEDRLTNFDPAIFDPSQAYQISSSNVRVKGTGDPMNGLVVANENSPYGRRVTENPWANFGPRVGFSWDPRNDGRTALRGGYGLYFDRTLVGIALQNAFVNPPFAFTAVVSATGGSGPTLSNPTAGAARDNEILVPNLIAMSPDFKVPRTHQWSVGVQHELPWGFVTDIAYVGSAGRDLLRAYDINQTPAGVLGATNAARPYRGWGNITLRATDATSTYNALQMSLSRRYRNGVQVNVNYTLSKVETDSPSDRSDVAQDINNLEAERAVASYDRTHIFGANYVIDLPFYTDESNKLKWNFLGGWQISGYTRYESGVPLTITQSANTMNSTGNIQRRPNLTGEPEGPKTIEQWFNTAAFALPAANTFGSSPRSVVRGPYRHITDLALFKNFIVTDRVRLQYRLEAFNVFNHTNFTGVGTVLGTPSFGRLTGAAEPRLVQMGLKVTF
jgi:hypothetical protein